MASRLFRAHGHFCATHPWEVIVATLTLAACMLSYEQRPRLEAERRNNATDVILMTLVRCIAVLYSYYQVCNLHQLGSKYLLVIAALFTAFSSFIFTSAVLNVFDVSDLKDALFFFLLLIDLSKIASLARFAMSSSSQDEIRHNISRGMARIGPSITLDTVVETLVIGVGTLSGVHRLETLCKFACLSVIVNYIVFMTFYPACLSLILELSRSADYKILYNDVSRSFFCNLKDENDKPNLVVQRIKLIMSAGLMLVHAHSRWLLSDERYGSPNTAIATDELFMQSNCTETPSTSLQGTIIKWLTVSADQIVILILLLALAVKFMMFKPKTEAQVTLSELDIKLRQKYKAKFGVDWIEDTKTLEVGVQTEVDKSCVVKYNETPEETEVQSPRPLEECKAIYKQDGPKKLSDVEIISLVKNKIIPFHQMENVMGDLERGVEIRRKYIEAELNRKAITDLPYQHYDYNKVMGACCENVIGYVPVPVGVAGPLNMDEKLFYVPMATTEGCLVASTNRGCRALMKHGVTTRVVADGMTRGPVVRFPSVARASLAMAWIKQPDSFDLIKSSFDATSGYARLTTVQVRIAGRYLFIRFVAKTGDAMGMNMLSKGTEVSLKFVQTHFEDMEIISLSGNYCADKKPAAVNWIEGRGKSVVCEAIVPADIVSSVLKTSVHALVDVNISKNMIGSAMAGSIGGFNAHAANVVTAIFIATGQDPAQNVSSSNCMTLMEPWGEKGDDLYISCTMPSIEIGTVGGGTTLGPQASCLEMLGVKGANVEHVGENANQLAKIICGTVLAGELSLMAALSAGHLVGSHLKYNRALKLTPCKSDSS